MQIYESGLLYIFVAQALGIMSEDAVQEIWACYKKHRGHTKRDELKFKSERGYRGTFGLQLFFLVECSLDLASHQTAHQRRKVYCVTNQRGTHDTRDILRFTCQE